MAWKNWHSKCYQNRVTSVDPFLIYAVRSDAVTQQPRKALKMKSVTSCQLHFLRSSVSGISYKLHLAPRVHHRCSTTPPWALPSLWSVPNFRFHVFMSARLLHACFQWYYRSSSHRNPKPALYFYTSLTIQDIQKGRNAAFVNVPSCHLTWEFLQRGFLSFSDHEHK